MSEAIKTVKSGLSHPEGKENELKSFTKHSVTSEIDFLKTMHLRSKLKAAANVTDAEKAIAGFKSEDDKRVEKFYKNLIGKYNAAAEDATQSSPEYFEMQYLYNRMGHISLFQMAQQLAEAQRKTQEVENFKKFAFEKLGGDS